MIGTLVKDFKNVAGQLVYYAAILVAFFIAGIATGNVYFYAGLTIFCGVAAPLSAVSYDEKDHWDAFALASGVTRRGLVFARYLLGLCVFLPAWGISFLYLAVPRMGTEQNLLAALTFGGFGLMVFDILLPLVFRIGVEKSRAVYILVILVVVLLSVGGASLVELAGGDPARVAAAAAAALGIAGVPASAAISCRVYAKKDF